MASSSSSSKGPLHLESFNIFSLLPYDSFQVFHSMISLKAKPSNEIGRQTRALLDLIAVIDVSSSMTGSKLEKVKDTLRFVISQLKQGDRLSIVSFHSQAQVVMPLSELSSIGKKIALDSVNSLKVKVGTNISAGLFEGLNQIIERGEKSKNDVVSILLLTDGQSSCGLRSLEEITQGMQSYIKKIQDPISVFTFGFGSDHNPVLLRGISEKANGMFYYIHTQSDVPTAFADCLGGLLSVVAQKIVLSIKAACDVIITQVQTSYPTITHEKLVDYEIFINDLSSEEERDFLFALSVPSLSTPNRESHLLDITLKYFSVLDERELVLHHQHTIQRVSMTSEEFESIKKDQNVVVLKQIHRLTVADALQRASEEASKLQYVDGQKILLEAQESIERSIARSDPYCQQLLGQVRQANSQILPNNYSLGGQASLLSQVNANLSQRSTTTSRMYQNSAKANLISIANNNNNNNISTYVNNNDSIDHNFSLPKKNIRKVSDEKTTTTQRVLGDKLIKLAEKIGDDQKKFETRDSLPSKIEKPTTHHATLTLFGDNSDKSNHNSDHHDTKSDDGMGNSNVDSDHDKKDKDVSP